MTADRSELEALGERVAAIEAENEMLRRQAGWLYRKWHTAEERVKALESTSVCRGCRLLKRRQEYASRRAAS